jgi:DNA-directed RNA polymerase subunit L
MSLIKFLPSSNLYLNNRYKKYGFQETIDQQHLMPIMFHGVDISLVNGLRRICVSEIDNLAFDNKIDIKSNTSQYHRDILIDRLGFITINMAYVEKEKLNEDDLVFVLSDSATTDKPLQNMTASIIKVFVHDHLKVFYKNHEHSIKDICPFNSILLTLNPQEEVWVVMTPSMGQGRQHPRWNSSIVMYKFGTKSDDLSSPEIETNQQQMDYKGKETRKPETILLTIESVGKMASSTVFRRGIQSLKRKLFNCQEELRLIPSSDKVIVETDDLMPNFAKFRFNNEDHTLGHALEYACLTELKQLIQSDESQLRECIAAYRKPHPLDNYIELVIRTPNNVDAAAATKPLTILVQAIDRLMGQCDSLLDNIKVF